MEIPRGKLDYVLDYYIVVGEFKLQLRYYVHFRTYTLRKGMNPLIPQLWVKEYCYCSSSLRKH